MSVATIAAPPEERSAEVLPADSAETSRETDSFSRAFQPVLDQQEVLDLGILDLDAGLVQTSEEEVSTDSEESDQSVDTTNVAVVEEQAAPDTGIAVEPERVALLDTDEMAVRKVKAVDWRNVIKDAALSEIVISNGDSENLAVVVAGMQLSRSYWGLSVSSLEYVTRTLEDFEFHPPRLSDLKETLSGFSREANLRELLAPTKLPGRTDIEERVVSPAYVADIAHAFVWAKQLAPGVVVLEDCPGIGGFMAAERYPVVLLTAKDSAGELVVESVFLNDHFLEEQGLLKDVLTRLWQAPEVGSLKTIYAGSEHLRHKKFRLPKRSGETAAVENKRQRQASRPQTGQEVTEAPAAEPVVDRPKPSQSTVSDAEYERLVEMCRAAGQIK